jgi:hypothetical protein
MERAQANKTQPKATDSDKSLGDINEKKFLSTLDVAT